MIDRLLARPRASDLETFQAVCAAHPYLAKGVFYSELYLFLRVCELVGVEALIESGVRAGVSTRILRAAFPGPVLSIDQVPCEVPRGVRFVRGDARDVIATLLRRPTGFRYGILIDGPKGATALALKARCFESSRAAVVAIHDLARGAGETYHSQHPSFRAQAGRALDRLIAHPYARKYPDGPGLGVWVHPALMEALT